MLTAATSGVNCHAEADTKARESPAKQPRTSGRVIIRAMNIQELFLKQKEALRGRTRQVTSLLREDHLTWRPVPGALSIGEMVRHLWVSEEGIRNLALNGDFSYFEKRIPGGLGAVLGIPRTIAIEIAALDSTQTETLAAAANFPLDRWEEDRAHGGLGFRRKVAIILFGINDHEVHHRAQLMTYLRILGTPVPEAIARR
jgi:uncharacterized damage-inducible protein DinB